ncbi:Tyrocidine synthase 3 [compost metagenome]
MQAFDLGQAPLLRAMLLQLNQEKHILLCDMHHLISDGVSIGNLSNEFAALYRGEELPPLQLQYKDYAVWQQGNFHRERLQRQEQYWLKTLSGELPVLDLPTDYARPAVRSFEGRTHTFKVGKPASDSLRQIAEHSGSTLYMVLLAAYTAMLAKYSRQEEIIVGTPVAGRSHAELAPLIGMFVNTLTLRSFPSSRKTFLHYLHEVKMHALEAFENQDYPYEELIEKLNIQRDMSRNPLFDTMFALQHTEQEATAIDGLQLKPYAIEQTTAKFDLMLTAIDSDEGIGFSFEYSSALFKPETV